MNARSGSWVVVLVLSGAGCGTSNRECNVGADCASGACRSDGSCVAVVPDAGGPGETGGPGLDAGPRSEAGRDAPASVDAGGCVPGPVSTIARDQVILGPGLHATFRIAESATIDTAGQAQSDGSKKWDLSTALPGDHDVLVETVSPAGSWYAADFANAGYASQLSDTVNLLGVFRTSPSALLLGGVVSPTGGAQKTELTYSPEVVTLQFPLMEGATWSTSATVTGYAQGFPGTYTEAYQSTVDAHGKLVTPLATFDVLRVGTVITRTQGVLVTVVRTYTWVTDCFGGVAAITSQNNETQAEFTSAAEVRRIAP